MKKKAKKKKGLIKGRSTAFLVSAGIHIALIIAAGTFVVFNIVKPPPVKFEPVQQLDRPKMRLKKLQVQVKENARPKDSTERIISKTTLSESDIELPPMSGAGEGLLGGGSIGGFTMMDDLAEMTLLGGQNSVGNDLVGTYYYLRQTRNGTPAKGMQGEDGATTVGGAYMKLLEDFFEKGWDHSVFDPYWRSPKKLYATQLFVPTVPSDLAPQKFGDTRGYDPMLWVVHYVGQIAQATGGRFRFVGFADDHLFVRINGETVLDATLDGARPAYISGWRPSAKEDLEWRIGKHARLKVGDWFELKPGEPADMEILVGERPGGFFSAMLLVQQEGVKYPKRDVGGPLLPIFKTAPTPPHLIDEMSYTLAPGYVDFYGGPIFSVY